MASYLLDRITMGTIISFRYSKPGVQAGTRNLLVLTPNFMGNLHGIKVAGLTPTEQEYIQTIFYTLYANPKDLFESIQKNMQLKLQEIQILNQQQADLIRQQQKVIVKPANVGMFGKAKSILGSVVGKISTFGRTQTQAQPNQDPRIQQELEKQKQAIYKKQEEFAQYQAYLEQEKAKWARVGRVPRDPYNMYHLVLKPMIGNLRMPGIYRKYKVQFIQTPRIVKSPGVIVAT